MQNISYAPSDTQKDVSHPQKCVSRPQFYQNSRFTYNLAHVKIILGGRIVAEIRDTHMLHFPGKRQNNR